MKEECSNFLLYQKKAKQIKNAKRSPTSAERISVPAPLPTTWGHQDQGLLRSYNKSYKEVNAV